MFPFFDLVKDALPFRNSARLQKFGLYGPNPIEFIKIFVTSGRLCDTGTIVAENSSSKLMTSV
jgi:hypothetical protein